MPQQPATSFADDLAKVRASFDADLAKVRAGNPIVEGKPPAEDDGGFFHWGARPSQRRAAEAEIASRANNPSEQRAVGLGLRRNDNQVGGMPPEMVPLMALKAVPGAIGAVRAGVGLAGKVGAAAGQAAPIIGYEATRRAATAVGVPDWMATVGAGLLFGRGGRGAARAAAGESAAARTTVNEARQVAAESGLSPTANRFHAPEVPKSADISPWKVNPNAPAPQPSRGLPAEQRVTVPRDQFNTGPDRSQWGSKNPITDTQGKAYPSTQTHEVHPSGVPSALDEKNRLVSAAYFKEKAALEEQAKLAQAVADAVRRKLAGGS